MRFFVLALLALFQVCLKAGPTPTTLYVGNVSIDSISVVDIATQSVIATITLQSGSLPFDITLNADSSRLYTANFVSGNISIIDTSTLQIIGTITVGGGVHDVTFNPEGTELWAVRFLSPTGFVSVINPETNTITHIITVGRAPREVNFQTTKNIAYVTNSGSSNISVIDTVNKTIIATISLNSCEPRSGVFTLNEDFYYVTDGFNVAPPLPAGVRVIDTNMLSEVAIIPAAGDNKTESIALTLDGKFVYATPQQPNQFITVIDTSTNTVSTAISVQSSINAIIVHPISGLIFTANSSLSNVGILDPSTNQFIGTITVGFGARSFAIPSNFAPLSVTAKSKSDLFLTQTERYNKITWETPPNISVAQFEIYRDASLTDLVATAPSNITEYLDHNVKKNTAYTYYVVGKSTAGLLLIKGNAVVITE